MKKLLSLVAALVLYVCVGVTPAEAGPRLECLKSKPTMRLAHNEGDFSRIGRVNGDVPRYTLYNTACISWGRFYFEESLNTVVGQSWTTVNGLGSGMSALKNPDTYGRDLTPHWFWDSNLWLGKGSTVAMILEFRISAFDNVVADHFGVGLEIDYMRLLGLD